MGGAPHADMRLIDLAECGPFGRRLALTLLRLQIGVYERTNHMLAYNDGPVWGELRRAAAGNAIPKCAVRCLRCPAAATLHDWQRLAAAGDLKRIMYRKIAAEMGNKAVLAVVCDCTGAKLAGGLLQSLMDGETWAAAHPRAAAEGGE